MLDDDDDFDDDDSVGVSVGDGEFAGDDGVAPHGKSGFFGTVAATCVFRDSGCGKCDTSGPRALGGVVFSFVLSFVVVAAAVAGSSLFSLSLSLHDRCHLVMLRRRRCQDRDNDEFSGAGPRQCCVLLVNWWRRCCSLLADNLP